MGKQTQTGVNLIELLVVVSMIGILAVMAVPAMSSWMAGTKLVTERDKLFKGFQYARSKAIERNLPYLMCPSTDGETCATAADWASGWVIAQTDVTTGVLVNIEKVEQALGSNAYTVTADQDAVQFLSTGTASPGITINICHDTLEDLDGQTIAVSPVGRASRTKIPDGGGVCQ